MLFTDACSWNCNGCYNKNTLVHEPELSSEEIISYLEESENLTKYITISGGEPTEYSSITGLVRYLYYRGYHIKLDTNGMHPDILNRLLPMLEVVAMDIKDDPEDSDAYSRITRCDVDLRKVQSSLRYLSDWYVGDPNNRTLILRTTLFDNLIDTEKIKNYLSRNNISYSDYRIQDDVRSTNGW